MPGGSRGCIAPMAHVQCHAALLTVLSVAPGEQDTRIRDCCRQRMATGGENDRPPVEAAGSKLSRRQPVFLVAQSQLTIVACTPNPE